MLDLLQRVGEPLLRQGSEDALGTPETGHRGGGLKRDMEIELGRGFGLHPGDGTGVDWTTIP